jgi:hypothetical protein
MLLNITENINNMSIHTNNQFNSTSGASMFFNNRSFINGFRSIKSKYQGLLVKPYLETSKERMNISTDIINQDYVD